jgi:hypothetical protein
MRIKAREKLDEDVGAIFFVILFSGWFSGAAWPQGDLASKLIEGAKKEKRLVHWTTMTLSQSKQVVDAFKKKYPFIEVDLFRTGGDAMLNKIFTEDRAGRYLWDVLLTRGDYAPQRSQALHRLRAFRGGAKTAGRLKPDTGP